MADISAWSPVDASNNQPPPDGWPENQSPSSVNNCARAMMGATRRWYEHTTWLYASTGTPNAIVVTYPVVPVPALGDVFVFGPIFNNTGPTTLDIGTGALPIQRGDVLLRGGELKAQIPVWVVFGETYWALGSSDSGDILPPLIVAGGTPNALVLTYGSGAPTALATGDRFTVWLIATNTGPATLNVQGLGPAPIVVIGNPLVGGELRVNTIVDFVWDGASFHLLDPAIGGPFMPLSGGTFTGAITAPAITSTGNITAASGTVQGQQLTSTGNITAAGTVSGNLVTADSISSNTTVNAATFNLRSAPFASMDAGATQTVIYDPGRANITLYASGTNYYQNTAHNITSRNTGGGETTYAIFSGGGSFNQNGTWGVISDDALKTDIRDYNERGLSEIKALRPVSFRYSGGPFAGAATRYGLIAQEAALIVPEMIGEEVFGDDRVLTMQPGHLIWLLIRSCQELAARVEALEIRP